jgi:glycosyltransferase involved in cell wall biosynthesis
LSSQNHNVTVLTLSNDTPAYKLNDTVKRITLSKKNDSKNYVVKNFVRIIRFRRYLKSSSSDIYLTMLPITINMMLFFKNIIKVPIIISERGDPKTRFRTAKFKKGIMKRLFPRADGFVFQTEEAKNYYKDIIGSRGIIIPNAINMDFVKPSYNGIRQKNIVSAGRFTSQKNFKLLIEAYSIFVKKFPDYNLIIYGEGILKEELKSQVEKLSLAHKVSFPGYVRELGDHIQDAAMFVLPSNYEGMPNALMEAMALGIPSISTDCPVGGPRFLITHNENGLLLPVDNLKELVYNMEKISLNKDLAEKISKNSVKVSETLNPNKIYKQWENYIKEIQSNF